jgi:hypothetical protein
MAIAFGYPAAPAPRTRPVRLSHSHNAPAAYTTARSGGAGLSPIYGLFLFLLLGVGGPLCLAGAQALMAAWALRHFVKHASPVNQAAILYSAAAVLAAATRMPILAALPTPDLLAGVDLLTAGFILVYAEDLEPRTFIAAFAVLVFGAAADPAHLATLLGLAILAPPVLMASGVRLQAALLRSAVLAVAAVGASCALYGAQALIFDETGVLERGPPVMMAQVLQDGEGRAYLAAVCPGGVAPALCKVRGQLLDNPGTLLGSDKPGRGAILAANARTRALLAREEPSFVIHAIMYRPWTAARAAGGRWAGALGRAIGSTAWRSRTHASAAGPGSIRPASGSDPNGGCRASPAACARPPEGDLLSTLAGGAGPAALVASVLILVAALVSRDMGAAIRALRPARRDDLKQAAAACALVMAGIILAIGVGAFIESDSPPDAADLLWLVPVMGVLWLWTLPWSAAAGLLRGRLSFLAPGPRPERTKAPFPGA